MASHKGKRDEDHDVDNHEADTTQKRSSQDGESAKVSGSDNAGDDYQHQHLAIPPVLNTSPAPAASSLAPALPSAPAVSQPLSTPIPSPSFQTVLASAKPPSTSNLATSTVFTPIPRLISTTSTSGQASDSSTLRYVVSTTLAEVASTTFVPPATSSPSLTRESVAAEISAGTISGSVSSATLLPSTNATPFGETATGKSTNASAVIAGSIFGVLALVLILLFTVYRKQTLHACLGKRRRGSGRPPIHADPEMVINRPSATFDVNNLGPLQRNPPNVADFFAINVKAPAVVRQRSETPENLSTVLEETASQHSRSQRNSQDSYPTPMVAQAVHIQPAATTNADNVPLLSLASSPFITGQPESTDQIDSRNSSGSMGNLKKLPAARHSIHRNRNSTETVESAPRFRTVESWVNSQAKRFNLPSVRRDSHHSEQASSVSSEAFRSSPNPPVPPKVSRIPAMLLPEDRSGTGRGYQKETRASTATVFRHHPGDEVQLRK